ncbi:cupin domain-containing protein [Pseudonocardia sp. RS010]|uniref:cupin domain-containing protein n=1 Tax=Pseudonocardia sp. RS010 TaxID=3385979 RepID=UPI0039A2DC86
MHRDPNPQTIAVPPDGGDHLTLGALPFQLMVNQEWVGGAYTLAKQPIAPRLLVAPHVHRHQDQVAFVTRGTVGFRVGEEEHVVEAGGLSLRNRGEPHALWNPTDEPAEILEITSPGDFERYFRRIGALSAAGEVTAGAVQEVADEYGLSFFDDWNKDLMRRYGVSLTGGFWD